MHVYTHVSVHVYTHVNAQVYIHTPVKFTRHIKIHPLHKHVNSPVNAHDYTRF